MLHVFMLGGRHARARIEVHDVAFANVDRPEDAYPQLRREWFGDAKGLHVDGWLAVDGVDGHQVRFGDVAPGSAAPRLFFVNLGGYVKGALGEAHDYLLLVAADLAEAEQKAKGLRDASWIMPHTDAVLDVDDCIAIDQVGGRYVQLQPGAHAEITLVSDYIVIG
ncbi:DUF1543 domain-containing protein [Stenotrophomonas rhizophila]